MSIRRFSYAVICGTVLVCVAPARASVGQQPTGGASGAGIFRLYCTSCHGPSAKGDGPMASVMTVRPADLTRIASRNRGAFPAEQVARIVDGRRPVKGHGGGEMPVGGDAFAKSVDPASVDEKIRRLVVYLESIQQP
jgi:mono/diheme cytochrome c family protein